MNEQLVFTSSILISISDRDVSETPGAQMQVSLMVNHGTLSLFKLNGLVFTNGDGTADASMTFVGTLSDINAALDGLVYVPNADFAGSEILTIITNDLGFTGEGGALTDTDTVSITISESYHLYIPLVVR
jgi:hypothetical protein